MSKKIQKIVAYCGGKWSVCTSGCTFVGPNAQNVSNITDNWDRAKLGYFKNETDADAFIIEKTFDVEGTVSSLTESNLHVFKTMCSPKMVCKYNKSNTMRTITNNRYIWKKVITPSGKSESSIEVMCDYNSFDGLETNSPYRIGTYGKKTPYSGFVTPVEIEYSFINLDSGGEVPTASTEDEDEVLNITGDIPSSTSEAMFSGVTTLTSCSIPCQMRTISNNTFRGCTGLTDYSNADWFDTIGEHAFDGCTSLKTITIGKPTTIQTYAFANCSGATTIEWLGNTYCNTAITTNAFENCESLKNTIYYPNGDLEPLDVDGTIWIPSGVTRIDDSAFRNCKKIENLDLNQVKEIGENAFYCCIGLREIENLSGVTNIEGRAFYSGGSEDIYYGIYFSDYYDSDDVYYDLHNVKEIGEEAFSNARFNGCNITLNENLKSLGVSAFTSCEGLGNVCLNNYSGLTVSKHCFDGSSMGNLEVNVFAVDDYAFNGLTLYDNSKCYISADTIGVSAFNNLTLDDGSECYISADTINNSNFSNMTAKSSLIHIYTNKINGFSFNNLETENDKFSEVEINAYNNDVEFVHINKNAFYSSTGIKKVSFNYKVELHSECFDDTPNIRTISFGEDGSYINSRAFTNCSALTEVIIAKSFVEVSRESNSFIGTTGTLTVKLNGYVKETGVVSPPWVQFYLNPSNNWTDCNIVDEKGTQIG